MRGSSPRMTQNVIAACPGRSAARSTSRSGALLSRGRNELRRLVRSRFCEAALRKSYALHRARDTVPYFAPAFCAYSHDACDSGTVRFADSIALALAAVPSRMRPAMPWVMPASRNRL